LMPNCGRSFDWTMFFFCFFLFFLCRSQNQQWRITGQCWRDCNGTSSRSLAISAGMD
jgi:hypothetical protein